MKKKNWITMAAVLALSTSLAVAAPHGDRGGRHGRGGFGSMLSEKLNLTAEQKAQLQTMHQSFRDQNRATFESARDAMKQYRAAKKAGDTARMEALKPALESQKSKMKELREQHEQQILSVLNAEQRTQFLALKAEREARRAERGDHHPRD